MLPMQTLAAASFDTAAVSYTHLDAGGYNISRLDSVFQGKDPREDVPAALTDMHNAFKEINGRMARNMGLTRAGKQKEQER